MDRSRHMTVPVLSFIIFSLATVPAALAQASPPPAFSKSFSPGTIGPYSVSKLTFVIDNTSAVPLPVDSLAFTDTLPAGLTIATPASAATDCGAAVLSAPDGGSTIGFSGGELGANSTCSVTVNVIGNAGGSFNNVSGDLTSSAGNSGPATATLTVDSARPGFSKAFAPSSIPLDGTSTLTFTIDNSGVGAADRASLSFSDILPAGMVVATPANAATTCGNATFPPTLTATPGTGSIALFASGILPNFPVLVAGGTCTVVVDVTTTSNGVFSNTSGQLSSDVGSSGFATAVLNVPVEFLVKSFIDDPVPPGGTVTLRFTVTNLNRDFPATLIAFADDLDPLGSLTGLVPSGALPTDPCGAGSTLAFAAGTGVLSLSGGSLPAAASCAFSVALDVPMAATAGTYPNLTDVITAEIDGAGVTGNKAADNLVVSNVPTFTKEFVDDPAAAGGAVTLRFTITNRHPGSPLTGIAFTDALNDALPGLVATGLPQTDVCGAGSQINGTSLLSLTGGSLAAAGSMGDSCTFDVVLDVPAGSPAGLYTNTTSDVTGVIDTVPVHGLPARDDLTVVGAPRLRKEFTDDPAQPGGTVTLQFTLSHDASASGDATAITFTDDLAATLAGLTATGLPLADLCGPGNGTLAGSALDSFLTVSGVALAAGETCTFSVTLDVPLAAAAGSYANTTSSVVATVAGVPGVTGNPASDDLRIAGLVLTKEFVNDPVLAGATVILRFTIDNIHPTADATAIAFTDNLATTLAGLTATGLPLADLCGPGNGTLTGSALDSFLTVSGVALPAGGTCTFSVTLQVPVATPSNAYSNTTSLVSALMDGSPASFDSASDVLVVANELIVLTKEFTDDPVAPGGTANLRFTLTSLATGALTSIAFSDDLDAALAGLVAVAPLPTATCGGTLSGTSVLTYSGGSLAAGASCSFDVSLQVPTGVVAGTVASNTTSVVSGLLGVLPVNGDPATDDLRIATLVWSKSFAGPAHGGGSVVLSFTIQNLDTTAGVSDLAFVDDLDAVLPGLVATGLPANNVCGSGSILSGTSSLSLAGGSLGPGATCNINVTLAVPLSASLGTFTNTTSQLRQGGAPVAEPATADLVIQAAALELQKSFTDDPVVPGGTVTLELTLSHGATPGDATGIAFTDDLDAALPGLVATGLPQNDVCGVGSQLSGTSLLSLTNGSLVPLASCTLSVTLQVPPLAAPGDYTNQTSPVTALVGSSPETFAGASDILSVVAAPTFPGEFFTLAPCRVLDTRGAPGPLGGPAIAGGVSRTFALVGQCGIPASARAVAVNLTVTEATVAGRLTLYAAGSAVPPTSTLNYTAGLTRANNAVAGLNPAGALAIQCVQDSGTAHVILDVTGYFE